MPYESFAQVYDIMMDDVPYDDWTNYIETILKKNNISPELILDLGCGTGSITNRLARKGFNMIGIDLSEDMLSIAKDKAREEDLEILYLCQDMREFELYGTVGCIVSICDSLNYILEEDELLEVFIRVNNYLDPNGLFIFDLNTEYKFKEIIGNKTYAETYDTCAYIWHNEYDQNEMLNLYDMTFFIQDGLHYQRFEELHYEKAYTVETIVSLLEKAGLKIEAIYDGLSFSTPKDTSERIYFIAREFQKLGGHKQ